MRNHANHPGDVKAITDLPLFAGVRPDLMCRITPEMVRFYEHDDVMLREGDEAEYLLVLLRGQACIYHEGVFLVSRQPQDVLGEQAFIDGCKRTATAIAQGTVRALALPRDLVMDLLEDAVFVRNLLRGVSAKLSAATTERAYHYRNEQRLFSGFRAHVSPEVTNMLLQSGEDYGEPRYIDGVVMFADIRSFTEASATMTPAEIAQQLSPYLDSVVEIIHRYRGTVDKFQGDAVLAVWGFPVANDRAAEQAFECAVELVQSAATRTYGGKPIRVGVGLNSGRIFIGNVGGLGKRQFTVLGSPVNLASRLEGQAKSLSVSIVVGSDLFARLPSHLQEGLTRRDGRLISGAGRQTVYTWTL